MFNTPLSVTDLYGGSILLSICLVILTVIITIHPLVVFLSVLTPPFLVTLRLVLLSKDYTEENLASVTSEVYISFLSVGFFFTAVLLFTTTNIASILWTPILFVLTLTPLYIIQSQLGDAYSDVEFGFRSSLPLSAFWKSGTVCMQNGRRTNSKLQKWIWYWLASKRFKTLTKRLDPDNPYSNINIAGRYLSLTSSLSNKYSPFTSSVKNVSEIDLDSVLVDFTQQECTRCNNRRPVSEMYILTDAGVVSEIFCEDCIETTQPGAAPSTEKSREFAEEQSTTQEPSEQSSKETSEANRSSERNTEETSSKTRTQVDDELKHALSVFNLTVEEFHNTEFDELKQQYRNRVQTTHPDTGGNAEEFKELVEAYKTLQKRV